MLVSPSSSPRKGGNSDLLCDEFAKGATEASNEVEKMYIVVHIKKITDASINQYLKNADENLNINVVN